MLFKEPGVQPQNDPLALQSSLTHILSIELAFNQ